jgi:hypothetical protein
MFLAPTRHGLETRVNAATIVVSAVVVTIAVAVAITNDDNNPCDGQDVDNRLHDGYKDLIVNNVPPSLLCSSKDYKGNAFLTRHAPSNAGVQSLEWQRHQGQSREEICEQQ